MTPKHSESAAAVKPVIEITKVQDFEREAMWLAARLVGRRCVECSKNIDLESDGVLYRVGETWALLHKGCDVVK